ncbi:MAG TPA: alpha/beta fold hydrolase, partial [Candidatus Binataceae bacterium]|nr:alpha/beta fold hydrolase [Candidatus Binataceae bacterium]
MSAPRSQFVEGSPRLHYLEWNPQGRETLVLVHGSSANAWWWRPLADSIDPARYRLLALDQRGHGDSEWARPPAYTPN